MVVPRSGCRRISTESGTMIRARGATSRIGSKRNRKFRARMAAEATTTTNFASSDGWRLNGPSGIHRAEPPTTAPVDGRRTRIRRTTVIPSSGGQTRCHVPYRIRDVASPTTSPTPA